MSHKVQVLMNLQQDPSSRFKHINEELPCTGEHLELQIRVYVETKPRRLSYILPIRSITIVM